MTPEERAKMKDALLAAGERSEAIPYGPIVRDLSHGPFMDLCLDRIEGAIREAVKAEREACCELCVEKMREAREYSEEERRLLGSNHDPNSYGAGYDAGELDAYEAVAAAIRERPL